jgi:hypothetical protein
VTEGPKRDREADFKSIQDDMDSQTISPESDGYRNVGAAPKIPLLHKLLLSILIVCIVLVSIWAKMDLLSEMNFAKADFDGYMDTGLVEFDIQTEMNALSQGDHDEISQFVWSDSTFYMITVNTTSTQRDGFNAGKFLMSTGTLDERVVGLDSIGGWNVGYGRFQSHVEANEVALRLNLDLDSFEIIRRNERSIIDLLDAQRYVSSMSGFVVELRESDLKAMAREVSRSQLTEKGIRFIKKGSSFYLGNFYSKEEAYLVGWYLNQAEWINGFEIMDLNQLQ